MGVGSGSAMLVLAAVAAGSASPPPPARGFSGVAVFRSIIIRMPLLRRTPAPPPAMVERKGPKCIAAGEIAGAGVSAPDAIDFVLKGGARLRARLDGACPALGFYGGFYMSPGADHRICADRDMIRTRAGGECGIDRFRRLEPPKP